MGVSKKVKMEQGISFVMDTHIAVYINLGENAGKTRVCEKTICETKIQGRRKTLTNTNVDTLDAVYKPKWRKSPEMPYFEG